MAYRAGGGRVGACPGREAASGSSSNHGVDKTNQNGVLKIVCERAEGVPGKRDVFMKVRLAGNEKRTAPQRGVNPRFNETFEMRGRLMDFLRPMTIGLYTQTRSNAPHEAVIELPAIDLRQYLTVMDSRHFELDGAKGGTLHFTVAWEPTIAPGLRGGAAHSGSGVASESPAGPGHRRTGSGGSSRSPVSQPGGSDGGTKHGQLAIRVQSAAGLKAADLNGKSDPYVVVKFGREKEQKTSVRERTLNPRWDETLQLGGHSLSEVLRTPLLVKVYDQDKRRVRELLSSSDDLLGETSVTLRELEHKESHGVQPPSPYTHAQNLCPAPSVPTLCGS